MLRLRVHRSDLSGRWRKDGDVWRSGTSYIAPFQHAALSSAVDAGARGFRLLQKELARNGDDLLLEIKADRLSLRAGARGVAPVYLSTDGDVLHGSWDPADLHTLLVADQLLDRTVARLLTRKHRYSTDTLFNGVHRLTERASATFDRKGLELRYPGDAEHVLAARRLSRGADPVEALERSLNQRIEPLVQEYSVGLELSGGVDSANVAVSAAQAASRPLEAFGLLVEGPEVVEQSLRRTALTTALGLNDHPVEASRHLPFHPRGARVADRPHYADGDVYHEAFDELRRRAVEAGVEVMLTGFGGDELMGLRSRERATALNAVPVPPWVSERTRDALVDVDVNIAPAAAMGVSCLMVFAARHPAYLRLGLWPAAPLADADLLRFSESLPVEWREKKKLLRDRLSRHGFSPAVTYPTIVESFEGVMAAALARYGLPMIAEMLERSILVDKEFVDRGRLAAEFRRVTAGGPMSPLLYDTLAVERGLRSMLGVGR